MKKRIISSVLSVTAILPTMLAINSNARYCETTSDLEIIAERYSDWTKIEDYEWLSCAKYYGYKTEDVLCIYATEEENGRLSVREFFPLNDFIVFNFSDAETAKDIVAAVDENLVFSSSENNEGFYKCSVSAKEITLQTAKELREALGDDVESYTYSFSKSHYLNITVYHPTGYREQFAGDDYNSVKETVKEYVKSAGVDAETIEYSSGDIDKDGNTVAHNQIRVVPSKEYTLDEYMTLGKDIYEKTGLKPIAAVQEKMSSLKGNEIDMTDYLNGDANRDKITSIADAAAIMQAIGNPDKYSLSDMGEFNADYDNNGLTVDDAVEIQKKLAGIE
ncbi:MAG: hypothetical protein IKV85_01130 [Ruminococcus sp.]|nr:hypothetical protein [Ruminococcus sp.]